MHIVKLPVGRYVVAVSGGVDSMVLLDMLRKQPELELMVAHVNHGLRADSAEDEALVTHYAKSHNIPMASTRLQLTHAGEEEARKARYAFLQQCCKDFNAKAIVLAHHQNDCIETALINYSRGTGWRGLAPFSASHTLVRPLLGHGKDDLIAYARRHNVPWREDSSNRDERYLRNRVRHSLMPLLDQKNDAWRHDFLQHIRKQQSLRRTIESILDELVELLVSTNQNTARLTRYALITLPPPLGHELLQHIFKRVLGHSLPGPIVERAVLFAKVGRANKTFVLNAQWQLRTTVRQLIVEPCTTVVS